MCERYCTLSKKDLKCAQALVETGFDVNAYTDENGATILHNILGEHLGKTYTLEDKKADVKWLLDNFNVNPNMQYFQIHFEGPMGLIYRWMVEDTRPPIFQVLREKKHDVELLKILIDKGADVNIKTLRIGRTPLSEAYGENNYEAFKLLLDRGADPCIETRSGSSVYKGIMINKEKDPYYSLINDKNIEDSVTSFL